MHRNMNVLSNYFLDNPVHLWTLAIACTFYTITDLQMQMAHTYFNSVNQFSFQMQGFSRLCVSLISYAKLTKSRIFVDRLSDYPFPVFESSVTVRLLFLVINAEVVHKNFFDLLMRK